MQVVVALLSYLFSQSQERDRWLFFYWSDTHRFYTCGCESYIYTNTQHILLSFFVPSYSFLGTPSRSAGSLRVFRWEKRRLFICSLKKEKETSTTPQKQLDYNTNLCGAKYVIGPPPPFRWMPLTNATAQHRLSSLTLNSIRGGRGRI